ncbi:transcriptional regulator [Candidatus Pacearchaeota archaeon]|nr:MAG: transcriptional regulator [Candidatus Pacearchaeota archaeon]
MDLDTQCEMCKILANPSRLAILNVLNKSPRTVSEIVKLTKLSQSTVSQHLAMMKSRGILEIKKKGAFSQYKIKYPQIMKALSIMKKIIKRVKKE